MNHKHKKPISTSRADDSAHVDFPQFVRTVASRYAELIVQGLLEKL